MDYVPMIVAAEMLGLHPNTVGRMVRRGDLKSYRVGTDRRVRLVSVAEVNALREVQLEQTP